MMKVYVKYKSYNDKIKDHLIDFSEITKNAFHNSDNAAQFFEYFRSECIYRYWCKYEYELFIKEENGRILLTCWHGDETLDVTNEQAFDWRGFCEYIWKKKKYGKFDVFDQLEYNGRLDKIIGKIWCQRA